MSENYNGMAIGVFELDNFVACFVALDAAAKAANIKVQSIERNRLKSCVTHNNRVTKHRHRSRNKNDNKQISWFYYRIPVTVQYIL